MILDRAKLPALREEVVSECGAPLSLVGSTYELPNRSPVDVPRDLPFGLIAPAICDKGKQSQAVSLKSSRWGKR